MENHSLDQEIWNITITMGKDAYSHQLTVFAVLITKQQYWIMSLRIKARTIKDFEMFTE